MASKKAGKTTKKTVRIKPVIVLPPMNIRVEDINTILGLLVSEENHVVLTALHTLNKYISNEDCMKMFLSRDIYQYLCNLLANDDILILRYSLKMLAEILINSNYLKKIKFNEVFTCFNPAVRIYLESEDIFLLESSSSIIAKLVNYNEIFAVHIFSSNLIAHLFEKMKTTKDIDIQKNSLEILFYLLQIKSAENKLPKIEIISVDILLCLLKSEIEDVKDFTLDIFTILTSWRNKNIVVNLTKGKVIEAMVNIIMNEDNEQHCLKALDIVKLCMCVKESAIQFCKTFEFITFSLWMKHCPINFIEPSTEILTILTKIPEIRQTMFDLSMEDTIVSLFRHAHEPIYILACEAISNMTTYRYCCDKIVTPSLITMLLDILKTTSISMTCLEAIIKTLHNFLKRNTGTLKILIKLNGFDLLLSLTETYESEISHECIETILQMILFCCKSKYLDEVCNFRMYKILFHLYECQQHELEVLNIIHQLITNEEFRKYFLEMNGPSVLLNELQNTENPNLFLHTLIVVQNMIPYKNIALAFLDEGLLTFLKNVNPEMKNEAKIVDDVIELLYNLCLSLKFLDTGRLEITDSLRDSFYLIHNNWFKGNSSTTTVSEENPVVCKPIYLVNYNVLKNVCKSDTIALFKKKSCSFTKIKKRFLEKDRELIYIVIHLKHTRNIYQLQSECPDFKIKHAPFSYGEASDDPYLADYIMEIHRRFFKDENAISSFKERVQFLAEYVDKHMSGFKEINNVKCKERTLQTHLMTLQAKLGSNLIPIGYLRIGHHCERALLFKVLADNVYLPVTLTRGNDDIYWNEVAFFHESPDHDPILQSNQFIYYVVDLMNEIGNLMPVGSAKAMKYCHLRSIRNIITSERCEGIK